jgi:hypothetical protein
MDTMLKQGFAADLHYRYKSATTTGMTKIYSVAYLVDTAAPSFDN